MTEDLMMVATPAHPHPGGHGGSGASPARPSTPLSSAGHLFALIRSGEATRRRDLLEVTGLSRSTITTRLDALLSAGLLTESGVTHGARGRPSTVLTPNPAYGVVLTADLGATHARAAVCDIHGVPLVEIARDLSIADGPHPVLDWLGSTWKHLLSADKVAGRGVIGIGVGVPGPVDPKTGRPSRPPIMPGWDAHPVAERLSESFGGVPAFLENDASAMAWGEYRAGDQSARSLMFVKMATGIGAGLVVDGRLARGATGGSGDIGHIRLSGEFANAACSCGSHGCLAATASGGAIARRLQELGRDAPRSRDAVRLAEQGDVEAIRLLRQAGTLMGDVLATATSLLNPDVLMVGGDLQSAQEHFMAALREELYRRSQPLATRELRVVTSTLGERSGLFGAAHIVLDEVFSADSVDLLLA